MRRTEESSHPLIEVINNPGTEDKNLAFARFGALCTKADAYEPIVNASTGLEAIDYQVAIFQGVWREGAELRRSRELLKLGTHITCPVVAIHGDYDSHPAEGVQKPLSAILKDFRFILLPNCGHRPWIERKARKRFFRILNEELQ